VTYLRRFEPLLGGDWFAIGRLLALAPHPDDEVLACGGLISAHRERGLPVDVVVMTDGAQGDASRAADLRYREERRDETRAALQVLGGCDVRFLNVPDGSLAARLDAVVTLRELILATKPETVVFPSPLEVHPDHRATALHGASALQGLSCPRRILACEIGAFMPTNVLLDITPHWARKEEAIACYRSQSVRQDLIGKVRALNRARTVNVDDPSIEYVEAYTVIDRAGLPAYFDAAECLAKLVDGMGPDPKTLRK
jgi:LmbE family N-acetylglucosaminyl deacetylase